jgi:hypothetical protein
MTKKQYEQLKNNDSFTIEGANRVGEMLQKQKDT